MPDSASKQTELDAQGDLRLSHPLLITEIVEFGGAERSLLALARWMAERGRAVHVVTYRDACGLAGYATLPLTVVELAPGGDSKARRKALQRYFAARPAEAPRAIVSGYQPALHATLAGVRGFHTLMHDTPSLFGDAATRSLKDRVRLAISNAIIARGLRSGGVTLVNSEFLRADCRKDFNIEARIVRMGGLKPEPGRFRLRPVGAGGELRMLSVCRVEANKRIDWMLDSLAALEAASPALSARTDWRLDLAGKGSLVGPLTERAQQLGLADRVQFHGFVPDDALEALYAEANLFLMPAVQGYGIPALEALDRGIPIVLHRESGVSDLLLRTPWATVLTGGPESMTPALSSAVDAVLAGAHLAVPLPPLPTEDEWAGNVAGLCGWA